jgi:Spy/CpxP family protein refolding chaperone
MNILRKVLIAGGCAALLALGTGNTMAQGRGNFDPAQMKQDMMDRLRDQMEIKDDQEWQAIEPKVSKVFDARRDMMAMGFRGFGGGRRRNNNNGDNGGNGGNGGDNARPRRNPFGEPSPAIEALQKSIDDKAPSAEIKAKLAAVHAEIKDKQAKLLVAQEDLRGVLTPRQEAIATVNGLLQ